MKALDAIIKFLTDPRAKETLQTVYHIFEKAEVSLDKAEQGLMKAQESISNFRQAVENTKKLVAGLYAFTENHQFQPLLTLLQAFSQSGG